MRTRFFLASAALASSALPLCSAENTELDPTSYNQWKDALKAVTATAVGELRSLPGFEVELLRTAKPEEGSWVAMAFEPSGTLLLAREDRGLLRLEVPETGQAQGATTLVEDTLQEVRGLRFLNGALFANANNSRQLVRLRDLDSDGKYEERIVLKETPGGVGHGRNQLAAGPDGSLWAIHGDDVRLPDGGADENSPLRDLAEDRLFAAAWDRFHWSHSVAPPCGHAIRTDPEGKSWQLFCGGLRNPFGIAFNAEGEAFTYDADMEWDVGLPWYRPTRVVHLVAGADYGWRGASRPMPTWMPDTWPGACSIGKGSPTAVVFGDRSHFPYPWNQALFIQDWAYGIIYAVTLIPCGSTYEGRAEVFLQGRPLNVTGMDFGNDGALYFTTGGRRTVSGLYRVKWRKDAVPPEAHKPKDQKALAEAKALREQRKGLEALLVGDLPPNCDAQIDAGLHSSDAFIRKAARLVLERQPPEKVRAWLQRAQVMAHDAHAAAGEIALAVARSKEKALQPELLQWICGRKPNDLPNESLATLLRAMQLSLIRHGKPDEALASTMLGWIESVTPRDDVAVDHLGGELLVFLESPRAISKLLPLAEKSATQEQRLQALFVLRHVRSGWTLDQRKNWLASFRREAAHAQGAHHLGVTFRYAKSEFESTLTSSEKAALEPDLAMVDPAAATMPKVEPRPFVKAWTMAELEPKLAAVAAADAKRGREIFLTQCAVCHRHGKDGGSIGPDLTGISGRFDRRALLESILDPWKVVADPYRIGTATLKSGEIISGPIVGEDESFISVVPNPIEPGSARKIAKSDTNAVSITSLMSPAQAFCLTEAEIFNLLAFLESK